MCEIVFPFQRGGSTGNSPQGLTEADTRKNFSYDANLDLLGKFTGVESARDAAFRMLSGILCCLSLDQMGI